MPAKASELAKVAQKLGFEKVRQREATLDGNILMVGQPQSLCMGRVGLVVGCSTRFLNNLELLRKSLRICVSYQLDYVLQISQ